MSHNKPFTHLSDSQWILIEKALKATLPKVRGTPRS